MARAAPLRNDERRAASCDDPRQLRRYLDTAVALARSLRASGGWREGARRLLAAEARLVCDLARTRPPGDRLEDVTALPNLVTKQAVTAIVALRIPDLVAGGTTELAALAHATGAHLDTLRRVCAHLVERGILLEEEGGRIALSETGELLRSDHPERRALFFEPGSAVPRLERALSGMLHSLRTGEPAYAEVNGRPFWDEAADEALVAESFDAEMSRHATRLGPVLATAYDWAPVRHVMDVGGGTGAVLASLLGHHGHLRGTIVEYADAAARARAAQAASAVADRLEVVEASFLEGLPAGADAYLLSWILHDWDDDAAATILRRCRDAAPAGGRVLVVEQAFERTRNTDLDLRMLVFFGGRERTRPEYEVLAEKAGLGVEAWHRLDDGLWLMDTRRR